MRAEVAPVGIGSSSGPRSKVSGDLVDRLAEGDASAYEELVRLHGPRMLAVASRYLPRPADAEDALQDAFVNVLRFIGGFNRESRLETWLHRVVVNSALMALRRGRRRHEAAAGDAALEGEASSRRARAATPTASAALLDREAQALVHTAVEGLPALQRSVFVLREDEGLGLNAIAEVLGVDVSTVKTRLHRARRTLQSTLHASLGESPTA